MKPTFWLTVVCWALVCLLLSISRQAGLNHPLQVASSSQWLDRCREPASGSPTASIVKSTQFDPARAGPLTSLVLDDAWTGGNVGPPGQETHGPPEPIRICRLPESWELLYFKLYKSQLAVIEQALETAGLMLGSEKSRGYCLEMICADFLAGANLQDGNPDALCLGVHRLVEMLSHEQQQQVLHQIETVS